MSEVSKQEKPFWREIFLLLHESSCKSIEEITFAVIPVLKAPTVGEGGYPEVFYF